MRVRFLFLIFIFITSATAQNKEEWKRIFTFENSVLEMNTSEVTFVNNDRGRVKFRTVSKDIVSLTDKPDVKYKTRLEVIEFNCEKKRWKSFETFFLDSNDKIVESLKTDAKTEWKELEDKSLMSRRFFYPACQLIEEKRRNP